MDLFFAGVRDLGHTIHAMQRRDLNEILEQEARERDRQRRYLEAEPFTDDDESDRGFDPNVDDAEDDALSREVGL